MSEDSISISKDKEIWKPVVGFEGEYEVSNCGRVKSLKYGRSTIRKKTEDSYGYHILILMKNGNRKHCKVHRLVADAFIPNPKELPTVNHKDCNKLNNHVDNLEWMSFSENSKHGFENGLMTGYGENHHKARLKENDVLDIINAYRMFDSITTTTLASAYDISQSNICAIIRGDTWKHIQP